MAPEILIGSEAERPYLFEASIPRSYSAYSLFVMFINDYKIDRADFQKAMHEKAKINIKKEVKSGNLTQDQADRMLTRMQ